MLAEAHTTGAGPQLMRARRSGAKTLGPVHTRTLLPRLRCPEPSGAIQTSGKLASAGRTPQHCARVLSLEGDSQSLEEPVDLNGSRLPRVPSPHSPPPPGAGTVGPAVRRGAGDHLKLAPPFSLQGVGGRVGRLHKPQPRANPRVGGQGFWLGRHRLPILLFYG